MHQTDLLQRMWGSMRASSDLSAQAGETTRVVHLDGVTATVTPQLPDRSVCNNVVYDDVGALELALDELAFTYADAGVRAWTVWVHPGDRAAAELLSGAGHVLDSTPMAMGMELDTLVAPPGDEPAWTGDWAHLHDAFLVNDRAWGDREGAFASVLGGLPEGSGHLYLARTDAGEPASFVLVHDHAGDCAFWFAATVPAARGHGLVSHLLHRALTDACERGCTTTTTQASRMGEPIYARLGYTPLGTLEMWERREAAPA